MFDTLRRRKRLHLRRIIGFKLVRASLFHLQAITLPHLSRGMVVESTAVPVGVYLAASKYTIVRTDLVTQGRYIS